MSWFRMSLLAAVFLPIAAAGSRLALRTQAQPLDATIAMTIDPFSGHCLPQVELGAGATGNVDLAVVWATLGDKLCCLDGAAPDDNSTDPVTLPWPSSARRTSFKIPESEDTDLHVFTGVRLKDSNNVLTYYYADEYYAITGEPHVWKPHKLVMDSATLASQKSAIDDAGTAWKARRDYEKAQREYEDNQKNYEVAVADLVLASGDANQQPRFGPTGGLHVTFVQPPGPSAMQVSIDRVTIIGPTHGIEPLHVWLWVVDSQVVTDCDHVPPLSKSTAFCDYTILPSSIPVPSDLNVNAFDPLKMLVPPGAQNICIVGIIEERSYTPSTHIQYRYHYGAQVAVPSSLPAPAPGPELMDWCPTLTSPPNP